MVIKETAVIGRNILHPLIKSLGLYYLSLNKWKSHLFFFVDLASPGVWKGYRNSICQLLQLLMNSVWIL